MRVECTCVECGAVFTRKPSNAGRFCSHRCAMTYNQSRRYGTPEERLWAKVVRADPDACWPWTGHTVSGYGRLKVGDRTVLAHRYAYELAYGPLHAELHIDHACCNPAHLEAVPPFINQRLKIERGRQHRPIGATNPNARLSEDDVRAVRRALAGGASQRGLARVYGTSKTAIRRIARGLGWTHLT